MLLWYNFYKEVGVLMKKFINFITKPRNLYLSIAVLLIVVIALTSISFSYYIEDTTDATQELKVNKINTFIQSDQLTSDEVVVPARSNKVVSINVISNNDYKTIYKLYYVAPGGVEVKSDKEIVNEIDSNDVYNYNLNFINNTDEEQVVKLGIATGYVGSSIDVSGMEIKSE